MDYVEIYNYLTDSLLLSFAKSFSFFQTCQIHKTETEKENYVVMWSNLVFKPNTRSKIIKSRLLFQNHSTLQTLTKSLSAARFNQVSKVNLFSDSSPFTVATSGPGKICLYLVNSVLQT
jgi:hypothetical protein